MGTVAVAPGGVVEVVPDDGAVPGMEDVPGDDTVVVVATVVAVDIPSVEELDGSPDEEHPRPAGTAARRSRAVNASVVSVTSPRLFNPAPRFVRALLERRARRFVRARCVVPSKDSTLC